jgi:hypothetical protein
MAAATRGAREQRQQPPGQAARAGLVRASRHQADARWVYYERDEEACAAALAEIERVLG